MVQLNELVREMDLKEKNYDLDEDEFKNFKLN